MGGIRVFFPKKRAKTFFEKKRDNDISSTKKGSKVFLNRYRYAFSIIFGSKVWILQTFKRVTSLLQVTVTDGSHAVVQGIARVDDEWKTVCKKGKIENADYTRYCIHQQKKPAFLAESDYRKGGQPAGY